MAAAGEVKTTILRPKLRRMAKASNVKPITTSRRNTASRTYRAKIEAVLDEADNERLARVWKRVCLFAIRL
jgi:hypothetical protein